MGKIVPLPVSVKLVCSSCGAGGEGSCRCGAPYVPAKQRVAAYDKVKPGRSTRQAAADLGLNNKTVHKARKAGVAWATPEARSGVNQFTPGKARKSGDNQLSPEARSGVRLRTPGKTSGDAPASPGAGFPVYFGSCHGGRVTSAPNRITGRDGKSYPAKRLRANGSMKADISAFLGRVCDETEELARQFKVLMEKHGAQINESMQTKEDITKGVCAGGKVLTDLVKHLK